MMDIRHFSLVVSLLVLVLQRYQQVLLCITLMETL